MESGARKRVYMPFGALLLLAATFVAVMGLGAYNLNRDLFWAGELVVIFPDWLANNASRLILPWLDFDIAQNYFGATSLVYELLVNGWRSVFGTVEFSLRLLSLFWGILTVAWIYRLGADISNRRVGLLAAVLMAGSSLFVFYTHELQLHTFLLLLSTIVLWAYWQLSSGRYKENPTLQAVFWVVGMLFLTAHPTALLPIIGVNLHHAFKTRTERAPAACWDVLLLVNSFAVLLYLPDTLIFLLNSFSTLYKGGVLVGFGVLIGIWLVLALRRFSRSELRWQWGFTVLHLLALWVVLLVLLLFLPAKDIPGRAESSVWMMYFARYHVLLLLVFLSVSVVLPVPEQRRKSRLLLVITGGAVYLSVALSILHSETLVYMSRNASVENFANTLEAILDALSNGLSWMIGLALGLSAIHIHRRGIRFYSIIMLTLAVYGFWIGIWGEFKNGAHHLTMLVPVTVLIIAVGFDAISHRKVARLITGLFILLWMITGAYNSIQPSRITGILGVNAIAKSQFNEALSIFNRCATEQHGVITTPLIVDSATDVDKQIAGYYWDPLERKGIGIQLVDARDSDRDITNSFNPRSASSVDVQWHLRVGTETDIDARFEQQPSRDLAYVVSFRTPHIILRSSVSPHLDPALLNCLRNFEHEIALYPYAAHTRLFADDFAEPILQRYWWVSNENTQYALTQDPDGDLLDARTGNFWSFFVPFTNGILHNALFQTRFRILEGNERISDFYVIMRDSEFGNYAGLVDVDNNTVHIAYHETDRRIILAEEFVPVRNNEWHTLSMRVTGQMIELYLDGRLVAVAEDERLSAGGVSIGIPPNSAIQIDYVEIFDLSSVAE